MKLIATRIITADISRLVEFYQAITQIEPTMYTKDYFELITEGASLALASTATLQFYGSEFARPAANQSAMTEFLVDDVDAVYERIKSLIEDSIVQAPTTMPWGNRSLIFKDPDGNLVNLLTPATR